MSRSIDLIYSKYQFRKRKLKNKNIVRNKNLDINSWIETWYSIEHYDDI